MRARFLSTWKVTLVCGLIATAAAGCSSEDDAQRVLVIATGDSVYMDQMLTDEVGVMLTMLEEAGVEAVVAAPGGEALQGETTSLEADIALADVVVSDYDGVMLPCMAPSSARDDKTVDIVREAAEAGMPVAAQHDAVSVLANAGALDGKEYAADAPFGSWVVDDGTHVGTGVVADGNVITSATCPRAAEYYDRPDGTSELTQALIAALG